MRTKVKVTSQRRILCLFPAYTPSFGTFSHAYKLMPGVRAFMPPQGLLLIAAYLPPEWQGRFIDENISATTNADFQWAEAGFVSGMHIPRPHMNGNFPRPPALPLGGGDAGPPASLWPGVYPS